MTLSNLTYTDFGYNAIITNINNLDMIRTPVRIVQNVPWQLRIWSEHDESGRYLSASVTCLKYDPNEFWTIPARIVFRLLSFEPLILPRKRWVGQCIFNKAKYVWGKENLISWEELHDIRKKYVSNDTIKFEIDVEFYPVGRNRCDLTKEVLLCSLRRMAYRFKLTNARQLVAVEISNFIFRDLEFRLTICRAQELEIILRPKTPGVEVPYQIQLTVRVISRPNQSRSVKKRFIVCKQYEQLSVFNTNSTGLILWNDVLKPENGFVLHSSLRFDFDIEVVNPPVNGCDKRKANGSIFDESPPSKM